MSRYRGKDWTEYSEMEWDLLALLHWYADQGTLKQHPFTGETIVLGTDFATRPDYYFAWPAGVCVYVDGPHHQHTIHAQRDREVSRRLIDLGYFPLRQPYVTYTKARRNAMAMEIITTVDARIKAYYTPQFQIKPRRRGTVISRTVDDKR
jgi:hypothetical protein